MKKKIKDKIKKLFLDRVPKWERAGFRSEEIDQAIEVQLEAIAISDRQIREINETPVYSFIEYQEAQKENYKQGAIDMYQAICHGDPAMSIHYDAQKFLDSLENNGSGTKASD